MNYRAVLVLGLFGCGPAVVADAEGSTGTDYMEGSTTDLPPGSSSSVDPVPTPPSTSSTVTSATAGSDETTADGTDTGSSSGDAVQCDSPALDPADRLELSGAPMRGDPDAPVTLVEWLGFEDPFSRGVYSTVQELMAMPEFAGQIRFVVKQSPFAFHPNGYDAATAVLAAAEQGEFWAYHDLLFEYEGELDAAALDMLAVQLDLDLDAFHEAMGSKAVSDQIDADRELGIEVFGSLATPVFVFNGREVTGNQPPAVFVDAATSELDATMALLNAGQSVCEAYASRLEANLGP